MKTAKTRTATPGGTAVVATSTPAKIAAQKTECQDAGSGAIKDTLCCTVAILLSSSVAMSAYAVDAERTKMDRLGCANLASFPFVHAVQL